MGAIQNLDPKRNPVTTIVGTLFLMASLILFIAPYFVVLKEPIPWWLPILGVFLGLLLMFMNDEYFSKIFNRADKIAGKKTDTE